MASQALLKIRFPDGTIRYGNYACTSDVPYEAITDGYELWDCLPLRWDYDAPEGEPVPVEIACNYGGGFWWPGTALPDRLVDSGLSFEGWEEIRTPHNQGLPAWWNDDRHAMEDPPLSTTLPCCFGEGDVHLPSCRFAQG